MIKSKYFKTKYKYTQINNFYIFYYIETNKSEDVLINYRTYYLNHFKHLVLPSSFKLVKDQSVQGPGICILYSSGLGFKQVSFFHSLNATSFRYFNRWYAYKLLADLKLYKEITDLCINLDYALVKENLDIIHNSQSFLFKRV